MQWKLKWSDTTEEKHLSLTGHLEELRYRLVVSLITVGVCFAALYPFSENLLRILHVPIQNEQLYMLSPAEAFVVHLKLAAFAAIVVAVPMLLYQIWAFIAPGLYSNEKQYALPFVLVATGFFLFGGLFAFFVMLPFALKFLIGFGGSLIQPMISVTNYVSFVTTMMLVFGVVFELPVILVFLAKMGIVTPAHLRSFRKYAIVGAFIVGAILTPPDVVSQIMLAGPLLVLYEISIWACKIFAKLEVSEEPK
ncbi:twin arginine-targeting protein translocase TatC [Candidatus Moduliflexus flocculans]|uniref:Sec-independent protein translocase protein TatC n=1 Tax=Candidatus Moduliflexus flocculans TaxID=1499966 RepID=A0A0S6VRB5_9BACT|nr:twin arginine-targeting protein translocase TatC [Candidatus Moduliflexus flocculans]